MQKRREKKACLWKEEARRVTSAIRAKLFEIIFENSTAESLFGTFTHFPPLLKAMKKRQKKSNVGKKR